MSLQDKSEGKTLRNKAIINHLLVGSKMSEEYLLLFQIVINLNSNMV
jgi:hypothetical protein